MQEWGNMSITVLTLTPRITHDQYLHNFRYLRSLSTYARVIRFLPRVIRNLLLRKINTLIKIKQRLIDPQPPCYIMIYFIVFAP